MAASSVTPIRKQYLRIRSQHPGAILFFRLGDFYETFDEDAELTSRELDLVLTSRPIGKNQRVPMAGVPHHAAENYISRLIAKGHKVALCEQMGTETVGGIMPREVVRIFTPGTVVEAGMLDARRSNHLVAVIMEEGRAGLAFADITTGDFQTTQLASEQEVVDELLRLEPSEFILPDGTEPPHHQPDLHTTFYPRWRFEEGNARQALGEHFAVATLEAFGCENKPLAVRAAGAVLAYLSETQQGNLAQIQGLSTYSVEGFMNLDGATRRNLEIISSLDGSKENSLLGVLDRTKTPMGARLLRDRMARPLVQVEPLDSRLNQIEAFSQAGLLRTNVRKILARVPDLERLISRVASLRATPRDVQEVGVALRLMPELATAMSVDGDERYEEIMEELSSRLDPVAEASDLIGAAMVADAPSRLGKPGLFNAGYSILLDEVVNSSAHARQWVENLEASERKRTGINSLKVGYNRVFGYYIEVSRSKSDQVPEEYVRKQTLANVERYITSELKEYETIILNAEEHILEIERGLFSELCRQVAGWLTRIQDSARAVGEIDVAAALAEVAGIENYVRPVLSHDVSLEIVAGRHPVVEKNLLLERFVPNDCSFPEEERIHIITGPNMSGKSTYLRQTALIVLMAQIGSYVPAESARIGLTDRIFTRIGARDELHAGRSTFMVEMVETARILNHASGRSLLILDEIGRGTSTYDGLSIAWALVEHLHNHPRLRSRTLFATHYHELTGLAETLPMVANYNVAVAEEGDQVIFLHHIRPGGSDRSYGIHVAQLAGLPRDIVNRAGEVLRSLEEHAPSASVRPDRLRSAQQSALFPESSPILDELTQLDITSMTPLEAINKLYEWKKRFSEE